MQPPRTWILSHSQLVAGRMAYILRSAYNFGQRSSRHSLRALAAEFGLSFLSFEEYPKDIKKLICAVIFHLPICGICCVVLEYPRINEFNYLCSTWSGIEKVLDVKDPATGNHLCGCWWSHRRLTNHRPCHTAQTLRDRGDLTRTQTYLFGGKKCLNSSVEQRNKEMNMLMGR